MSELDKGKAKAREPPPTLFLHPSPTASHVSLPGIMAPGVPAVSQAQPPVPPTSSSSILRTGSLRGSSAAMDRESLPASLTSPTDMASRRPGQTQAQALSSTGGTTGGPALGLNLQLQTTRRESTRATDRTDALWAEMQATLEEVELSASGGTRVFGPEHDRKLAELRAAQIALAQAWARSEADEAIETGGGLGELQRIPKVPVAEVSADGAGKSEGPGLGGDTAKSAAGSGPARPGSSGGQERLGAKLREETELDILLARKRREANDRYFQRVNQGVLDVVAKLEDVAVSMRAVEQESKDIWGDGLGETESVPGSAKP